MCGKPLQAVCDAIKSKAKVQASFRAGWRRATHDAHKTNKANKTNHIAIGCVGLSRKETVGGKPIVRMVVTTAAVEVAPVDVGVTVDGVSVQVESKGAPVQVKATGVVKPLSSVTVTVTLVVLPAATLAVAGDTAMPKSGLPVLPVPVRAAICGLLASLSATLRVAAAAAAAVGVKVTLIVQVAPMASVVPQVVVSANEVGDAPPMVMAIAASAAALLFVKVTVFAGLVALMDWLPNATVVGVRNTAAGAAVPVPMSEIVCGLPAALSVIMSAALSSEVVDGVKTTAMVQVELAARVVRQVEVPWVKSAALAPVNEMAMPLTEVPVLLNKVTVFAALGVCTI